MFLLSGCHGTSLFERPTVDDPPPIILLRGRYQRCLTPTDPAEFVLTIDRFERVMLMGSEPPSWMRSWGDHARNHPLRTAVDPAAIGAACTLSAAAAVVEAGRLIEAQALYTRVLARYSSRDWPYFVDQAKVALASLSGSAPAIIALRSDRALFR